MDEKVQEKRRGLLHAGGRTYFTGKAERTFFFVFTLILLLWGLLAKLGLWGE